MTIQTASGNIEVGPGDKVFVVNGVEFVIKVRNLGADAGNMLVVGTNKGSGWDEGVFAMNDALPATGDAHAILMAALPAINSIVATNAPATNVPGTDLPHQVDAAIQTLVVVSGKIQFPA